MNFEIKKLTANLLDDWLKFFDNDAFSDNDKWSGCYCMNYHQNEAVVEKRSWDCSKAGAVFNRECAVELIKQGIMQGYLAYFAGKVVGWCNANDKQVYHSVHMDFSCDESKKVKSIVCFCISSIFRGRGIASKILAKICLDAADDGYEYIEAYPFENENWVFHGSKSMYEKNGFVVCGVDSGCTIVRKYL
jgi:GNAT superfamily N-acetyltransferase